MNNKQSLDIPVYVDVFPNVEDSNEDRIEITIGENVIDVKGSMTGELLTGIEHIFKIAPSSEGDGLQFKGCIKRSRDGKLPHCSIKLVRSMTAYGMRTFCEFAMSGSVMRYTDPDQEAPRKIAAAFAQVLGLKQKDKSGRHYAGIVVVTEEVTV